MGRWLNWDPIAEKGGFNLYLYCRNNSLNNIDSYGLYIDDENDIGKRYAYTCRCGWLDAEHFSGYYRRYIKIYYKMRAWKKGSIVIDSEIPYYLDRPREYSWDFNAGQNIDYHAEATKLLYAVSIQEEADQAKAMAGLAGDMTSFAYEDIASNMFGGLIGRILIRRVTNKEINVGTALYDKTAYGSALAEAFVRCVIVKKKEAIRVYRCNKDVLSGETGVTHKGIKQSKLKCDPCKNEPYKTRLKTADKHWEQIVSGSKN